MDGAVVEADAPDQKSGGTQPPDQPPPDQPPSGRPRRRRPWPVWGRLLVWIAFFAVVAVAGTLLADHSSVRAASLRMADSGIEPEQVAPLPAELTTLWSGESTGPNPPVAAGGSIITTTEHGVSSRSVTDGTERWHYTRSDAELCGAFPSGQTVVAVFRTDERCDEAIGLDVGTGFRRWYRSINLRADMRLVGSDVTTLAVTDTGLLAMDAWNSGAKRFRYRPPADCLIQDARVGLAGIIVALHCTPAGQPTVTSLQSLNMFSGKRQWSVNLSGESATVLAADSVVAAAVGNPDLPSLIQVFATNGAPLATIDDPSLPELDADPAPGTAPAVVEAVGRAVVWTGAQATGISLQDGSLLWTEESSVRPDLTSPAEVLVVQGQEVVRLGAADGAELGRSTVDADLTGAVLARVGGGLVATIGSQVTVFG